MRKLRRIVAFIIVLIVVGAVAIFVLADRVVRSAVETAGTRTLNVGVTVGSADVSLLGGEVDLRDITVANPPGFTDPTLLKLQRVDVTAATRSLLSDSVIITDMKLDTMEVFVEQNGLENNLYQVIEPLRRPHEATGKGLVIDRLEITHITVHAGLAGLAGRPQSMQFTLPGIVMTDLGADEKMDTGMLIGRILLAVAAGIIEQHADLLPQKAAGEIGDILNKAINLGQSVTEGLKTILGGDKKQ